MDEIAERWTNPEKPPSDAETMRWIGSKGAACWRRVRDFINANYPGVFSPEWLYGGKKHGWSLRYKKGKSFCTLIPERGRFALVLVFGRDERERMENLKSDLSAQTRHAYEAAATYHDGTWLRLDVRDARTVRDIEKLLALKRKPKPGKIV